MTAAGPEKPSFNLLRWFSILGLVSIILVSSVSALLMSRFLTQNLLQRDAVMTMELVNTILRTERALSYFGKPDESHSGAVAAQPADATPPVGAGRASGGTDFIGQILRLEKAASYFGGMSRKEANKEIEDFFEHVAQMPDVFRSHVYLRDRSIIWSSDPSLIGTKAESNKELDMAFAGKLKVELDVSGHTEKEEHAFFDRPGVQFIENYIPIWLNDRRSVWGVVEVYRTPHTLFEAIRRGNQLVWASALGGGVFLYVTLFWIVRRANTLIQRQQARLVESETLAAVGEMASAVAHGLRNPLASIRSSAELALEEGAPERVSGPLADIVRQADRLDGWVRQLLTSSRPAIGDVERIRLDDVFRECMEGFAAQARENGIDVVLDIAEDTPLVEANATALGQVMNSIIANAVEAMPDGGTLSVTTRTAAGRRAVEVTVRDTGRGLSRKQARKVFQPFVTTKRSGLGLGLPLARRIVERHGGTLELSSAKGGGTVVTLSIPAAG